MSKLIIFFRFLEKNSKKSLLESKKTLTLQNFSGKPILVPWMSGLVNGLQNRLRRFESARHLMNPKCVI